MADVRLTATNPEDSSVVPVACNAKGELLLEEPSVSSDEFVVKAGDTMTGNLHLGDKITLNPDGSAQFAGGVIDIYDNGSLVSGGYARFATFATVGAAGGNRVDIDQSGAIAGYNNGSNTWLITAQGGATFVSDVVIGSRNKQWMIVESNGLAHLVEQTRAAEMEETTYPPLRDIPSELTMVEQQLQKVMERLRMAPEAGWEVWDGSDEN